MKLNILIISQNENIRSILSSFLAVEGHEARSASNQSDGIEAISSNRPDLVIIEVSMPEISAIETVKVLHRGSTTRSIPVIVISDFTELEIELLHIFDFICKPVDLARLREDLEILAQGRKKRGNQADADQLSAEDHIKFHDFLIAHSGLHFERRNIKMLERGLKNRMTALRITRFADYFDFLNKNREKRLELQKLLQFLTVGETFFFRYHPHFSVLASRITSLKEKHAEHSPLRFWSAGCATGEEPYSIAMTIMESLPDWKKRNIRIFATDINNLALKSAREGVYSSWKMRVTEKKYLDKYFKKIGESYVVRDEVKSLVEFSHVNLQEAVVDSSSLPKGFDAIFCRNVMIYFTTSTTKKVVETFNTLLKPGGALFLGHAETLAHISSEFDRHLHEGGFYYLKKIESPPAKTDTASELKPVNRNQDIKLASAPLPGKVSSPALPAPTDITVEIEKLFRQGTTLIEQEKFREAENPLRQILALEPQHTGAILAESLIQANNGHIKNALQTCNRVLVINDLVPEAYYLRGLLYEMTDREEDAVHEYRKAILLDMDFVMPHYQLGKLYFRTGQQKSGARELKNSLKLLEKSGRESIIPYSGGLSREVFLGQLTNELVRVEMMMTA